MEAVTSSFNSKNTPELINLENFIISISNQNEKIVNGKLNQYNIPIEDDENANLDTQVNSSRVSIDNERSNNNNISNSNQINNQDSVLLKASKIDLKKNTLIYANKLKANISNNLFNRKIKPTNSEL